MAIVVEMSENLAETSKIFREQFQANWRNMPCRKGVCGQYTTLGSILLPLMNTTGKHNAQLVLNCYDETHNAWDYVVNLF